MVADKILKKIANILTLRETRIFLPFITALSDYNLNDNYGNNTCTYYKIADREWQLN